MAGRGVDILLGGNPEGLAREMLRRQEVDMTTATPEQWESAFADAKDRCAKDRQKVLAAGGLYVLGTERHEARRIDNQLRGRAGRQGDPGETRFYLSLEDDLMRRFNGEQVKKFMSWANLPEDEPLEHNLVTRSIEQAQIRVEGHNFDIRKRVLEYDDVVNRQREIIYNQRREWLDKLPEDLHEDYLELVKHRIQQVVETHAEPEDTLDYWDVDLLHKDLFTVFPVPETINPDTMVEMTRAQLQDQLVAAAEDALKRKETELEAVNPGTAAYAQRLHMLRVIDFHWQRHLTALDMLREGIGLMSIAQRDPVVEYKREGFIMFDEMQGQITTHAVRDFFNIRAELPRIQQRQMQIARPVTNAPAAETPQTVRNVRKLGRNDPCWCGSGKKYKNCHMREDEAKERQHA
jgi:preprotein translocase subunit SecA